MEQKTREHLETAARNRDLAHALIDPESSIIVQPPPLDWAVVVAFYAAVHYVNAYLRERQRYEPGTHEARARAVAWVADLSGAYEACRRLRALAFEARYVPLFRVSRARAERALTSNLDQIEKTISVALNVAG